MKSILTSILFPLLTLIASAYISVSIPGLSIPFTAQSLVVFVVAGLLAPRHFIIVIVSYLALGAVGAPVFAEGSSGFAKILGNSGGFLYGFLFSGLFISILTKKQAETQFSRLLLVMLAATIVLFVFGVLHLAFRLDMEKALQFGLYPYWKMALVKAFLAAIAVFLVKRRLRTYK